MADYDGSTASVVSLDNAKTIEVDFATGHAAGKILKASGALSAAVGDKVLGMVIRAGSAAGNRTLVLVEGEVEHSAVHGIAAGVFIFSDGDGTASDAKPAGAAGTRVTEIGYAITTTRAYLKMSPYEKGA